MHPEDSAITANDIQIVSLENIILNVWQYVRFTEIWDESIAKYGRTRKGAEVALNRCIEEGILADYFLIHKKEVISDMDVLFDVDYNINVLKKETIILNTIEIIRNYNEPIN